MYRQWVAGVQSCIRARRGKHCAVLKLIVVHYHFRPGGVRRVIELATPHILRASGDGENTVTLVGGEARDAEWNAAFRKCAAPARVECVIDPALNYVSGQTISPRAIAARICAVLEPIIPSGVPNDCIVWAHNLSLARNVPLAREVVRVCVARGVPLVLHHHDWWFENRWARWPEMRRCGVRTLREAARVTFPTARNIHHAAINRANVASLRRHLDRRAAWLPNPAERIAPPPAQRVRTARKWLQHRIRDDAPVWLLPCRLLRRKNVAEALLLTRWLRPDAWLVTTGGISSDDEQDYGTALARAAHHHGWRLRLGVLEKSDARNPSIADLLATSEAVLLTSIVEGFGLPYVEAAAARRPLICRALPNVAPDLRHLGFRFPQSYADILIHPGLIDWSRESARQAAHFSRWNSGLPRSVQKWVGAPAAQAAPHAIAFSRLTLSAQFEILAQPPEHTWNLCAPFNPFLIAWQKRAATGTLGISAWPRRAIASLGGAAYAQSFARLVRQKPATGPGDARAIAAQAHFLRERLAAPHLFPLLWSRST